MKHNYRTFPTNLGLFSDHHRLQGWVKYEMTSKHFFFPSAPGVIRNHVVVWLRDQNQGGDSGVIHTYWVMMETQVAHETAELFVLQGRVSKDGI